MIIEFEMSKEGKIYKDALILPDDNTLTDEEIESMKQQRFDNWYAIITRPVEIEWQTDANGNQVLDENDNPIPVER